MVKMVFKSDRQRKAVMAKLNQGTTRSNVSPKMVRDIPRLQGLQRIRAIVVLNTVQKETDKDIKESTSKKEIKQLERDKITIKRIKIKLRMKRPLTNAELRKVIAETRELTIRKFEAGNLPGSLRSSKVRDDSRRIINTRLRQ